MVVDNLDGLMDWNMLDFGKEDYKMGKGFRRWKEVGRWGGYGKMAIGLGGSDSTL